MVKGETSAAALWGTVALAVAAGCGLWRLALMGTGLVLLALMSLAYNCLRQHGSAGSR